MGKINKIRDRKSKTLDELLAQLAREYLQPIDSVSVYSSNFDGETALHRFAILGDRQAVITLLEAGAEIDAKARDDGCTALYYAVKYGHVGVAEVLLENGANQHELTAMPVAIQSTPRMEALNSDNKEMIKLFRSYN